MTTDFWVIQWRWVGAGQSEEWMLWSDDPGQTGKVAPRLFFSKAEADQFGRDRQPAGTMFSAVRAKLRVLA